MKKGIIWSLLLAMLLSVLPVPAFAAEVDSGIYITVIQVDTDILEEIKKDEKIPLENLYNHVFVYESGKDLLFSAEDLARFSGFEKTVKDSSVTFTRGDKTITVDCEKSTVTVMGQSFRFDLPSEVRKENGEYYLSGAGMLPWLNVNPALLEGKLILAPAPVSLWELIPEMDFEKDVFSTKDCAKILGIKESKLKKAITQYQRGYKKSMKFITGNTDSDLQMYYDIFQDMVMDETAAGKSHDMMEEQLDVISHLAEFASMIASAYFPQVDGDNPFDIVGNLTTISTGVLSLMTFDAVFTEDLSVKIDILENLINNKITNYDRLMITAADQVAEKYTDYWTGLFQTAVYELAVNRSEFYDVPEIYNLLNVEAPAEEQMYRIHGYQKLMKTIAQILKKGPADYSYKSLRSYLLHAMLYYYALEQCYWGVAQYAIDTREGMSELDQLRTLAGEAQNMYSRLLTASMYLSYDNCTEKYGTVWSDNYLRTLAQVERLDYDPVINMAEHALYAESWNRDMDFQMNIWVSGDIDGDGERELILQGVYSDYSKTTMVTLDGSYISSISGKNFNVCASKDGSKIYLEEYFETGSTYYSWDGKQWNPLSQPDVGDYELLHIGETQDHLVSGEPGAMLSLLDSYFKKREGFMRSLTLDVEADGDEDRLYILEGAANLWNRRLVAQDGITDGVPQYEKLDRNVSLLLVLSESGGVRLRVQQLHLPMDINHQLVSETEFSGNVLRMGMQRYYYMDFGEPFTLYPPYESDFLSLMSMSWKEASKLLTKTRLWKTEDSYTDMARGYLNGMLVQLMVNGEKNQDPGAVISVSMMDWFPDIRNITQLDINEEALEPVTQWKAGEWVEDINGEELLLRWTYYLDPSTGEIYIVQAYFDEDVPGNALVRVDTKLIEIPPDGIREKLEAKVK